MDNDTAPRKVMKHHLKRCVINSGQTMSQHFPCILLCTSKEKGSASVGKDVEKLECLHLMAGMGSCTAHWKTVWQVLSYSVTQHFHLHIYIQWH